MGISVRLAVGSIVVSDTGQGVVRLGAATGGRRLKTRGDLRGGCVRRRSRPVVAVRSKGQIGLY